MAVEPSDSAAVPMPNSSDPKELLRYARQAYEKGDYKRAYELQVRQQYLNDSINREKMRQSSNDALSMSLEYRLAHEHELEAQRENDSLMAYNKELQMREYRSLLQSIETQKNAERLKWIAGSLLGLVAFIFALIYANIRRLQLQRLKEAYDKLEEATAAKERIESELRIAREIQMSMVPRDFPHSDRLDLYAQMTPAKEVGGDLYDFLVVGDRLYFCVGDVSGKGVPAALFMAESARLFRTLCKYRLTPAEIASAMNNELAQNNEQGMFVTMFIACLEISTGHLDFCNAGHTPPILDGSYMKMETNAPLGLWENLDFKGETVGSITGKQLFLYTDGLNEAENHLQDQYGDDRLLHILQGHKEMEPRSLIDLLSDDVEQHVGDAAPSDDMTMLCIKAK